MAHRETLRLMTWNPWWRFGERWGERQMGIAATLAVQQPDIIGPQGVLGQPGVVPAGGDLGARGSDLPVVVELRE